MRWGSDGGRCPEASVHAIAAWRLNTACGSELTTTPAAAYIQAQPQLADLQQSGAGVLDFSVAFVTTPRSSTGAETGATPSCP